MFTVQDESSMLVAHALGAEAEELILDSCAAPGGKSTHIAEQLKTVVELFPWTFMTIK